jgi:tetratricopeptide (TPR) repeat protein
MKKFITEGFIVYLAILAGIRFVIAGVFLLGDIFNGSRYVGRGGDDFSEIQSLVQKGLYSEAIEAYKIEYSKSENDERALIKIGEIYQIELKDFKAALNQFGVILRNTKDNAIKADMLFRMIEICRDHFPEHPSFISLCEKAIAEFPGSHAAQRAEETLSKREV